MAEGKRIYEIKINGLTESYEGVKNLREALDTLTDTVVNVTKQEEKSTASKKESKAATDALSKAQEKLNNWDKEYQTELAKTNAELSNNKKEINAAIKVQQAQEVVDAKQLDTYAQKQQYLSALNTLIRNHSTATEEDRNAIDRMVQESAALQAELKATDEQMKIYVRNVGNYPGAAKMVVESHKSLKQELKELKTEMAEMLASGVSKTDEAYLKLAERAGQLKDAMSDANQDITNFASDTRGLTNAINLASSAVNAYQLYNSVMSLVGDENEEAAKSMQKMMSVMTLLNSLQQVQNSLMENGSATARLYSKAVELIKAALGLKKKAVEEDTVATEASTRADNLNQAAEQKDAAAKKLNAAASKTEKTATEQSTLSTQKDTVQKNLNEQATNKMSIAQRAGAVASKTLSVALRAIPLMAIIGLVVELISRWEEIWNWLRKSVPWIDKVGKKFDEMGGFVNAAKSYFIGLVDFIKNVVMGTLDGLYNILVDIITLDWGKISQDWGQMGERVGNAWGNGMKKANDVAQEGITKKQNEEQLKRLKQQKDHLDITERNYKTHSKKYRKLVDDMYKLERSLAKDNADKLHEIDVQYARDKAELRDQDTKAAEEAAKNRKDAAEKAKQEWEKYKKEIDDLIVASEEAYQDVYRNVLRKSVDASNKAQLENLKQQEEQIVKDFIDAGRQVAGDGFDFQLNELQKAMSKRRVIMANELAFEAQDEKQAAQKRIETANKRIDEINKQLKNKKYKYKKEELEDEKRSLQEEIKQTETALQTLFNKYADNPINIPISIDVEGIYDRYEAIYSGASDTIGRISREIDETTDENRKKILQNQIDSAEAQQKLLNLWNPDAIIDSFLGVDNAFKDVFDNVIEYYYNLDEETQKNVDLNTLLINVFDQIGQAAGMSKTQLSEMRGALVGMLDSGESIEDTVIPTLQTMFHNLQNLNVQAALQKEKWEGDEEGLREYLDTFSLLDPTMQEASVQIKNFGDLSYDMMEKLKGADKEFDEALKKIAEGHIKAADEVITQQERIVTNFQNMSKDIKFEPVTDHSKYYDSHIIKLKETRENYNKLRTAYETYLASIAEGSEQMEKWEDAWQQKLDNTKFLYGEDSEQYKKMLHEKEQADAAYVVARKKTEQQLEDLTDKENKLPDDFLTGLGERIKEIYDIFNNNVMQPIQDGLGALFDFQLDELEEALEEIEKLYDKAVDAREESADRMKEINEELRNDEGQNKEALQQRLAEEEVLLVQREEAERALEKEKEKRKRAVERKEAQMRILELTQKLAEGIANTALGVTAALKYGPILGPIFAAIIGAMGAVQTAVIAKQIDKAKSQMEHGGKVGEKGISRSHKQGGHRIEDTNIEVEGGEWVINKKSSQKYDTVLRAINEDNPRLVRREIEIIREKQISRNTSTPFKRLFADGGRINTINAVNAVRENNEIAAITDLIKQIDFQPTVAVTDINRVSKSLVRVRQYAGAAG